MPSNSRKRTFAERVSLGLSLFIVGVVVSLVAYAWATGDNNPPVLSITSESNIRHIGQQYYVPFTVTNTGGSTAESVEIVAQLSTWEQKIETGKQQIDFLSRQEKRSGEFVFSHNPQQGELTIRVASYQLP